MYRVPLVLLFAWILRFGGDLVPSATEMRKIGTFMESVPGRVGSELRYGLINLLHECGLD